MTASTATATCLHHARELVARAHAGERVAGVERLEDGLTNAVYRVTTIGSAESLSVRVVSSRGDSATKETAVLDALQGRLPVPELLAFHAADRTLPHACVIYRWIPGITLNECRRHHAPATMESLGEPIGELLATLSGCPLDILTNDTRERLQAPRSSIDATLGATIHRLRGNRVRSRLGAARADALADLVRRRTSDLCALDSRVALVHGDVSGRNVLVASINERWQAAALLDWEHAFLGSPLWDVGSLFRYAHRYSEPFRSGFEAGYRAAGGALAEDWLFVARLLDATRLVEILDGANDLPAVFGECHDLVERLGNEAASRVCPL